MNKISCIAAFLFFGLFSCAIAEEDESKPIACGPFAFLTSDTYPIFKVYCFRDGVRLIAQNDSEKGERIEWILTKSSRCAIKREAVTKENPNGKEQILTRKETEQLIEKILADLEKFHGTKLFHKLKSFLNEDEGEDNRWILEREDSDNLIATILILDSVSSTQDKTTEEDGVLQPPQGSSVDQ